MYDQVEEEAKEDCVVVAVHAVGVVVVGVVLTGLSRETEVSTRKGAVVVDEG